MAPSTTHSNAAATPLEGSPAAAASADLAESFEHFCLATGIEALTQMMNADVDAIAGERDGHTRSKVALHGGPVDVRRPRVRSKATREEMALPTGEAVCSQDLLSQCTLNLMLLNVATRKSSRAVRMPGTGLPAANGSDLSKSAVSRRFKALSEARLAEWMGRDLSGLDLVAIQIDGLHLRETLVRHRRMSQHEQERKVASMQQMKQHRSVRFQHHLGQSLRRRFLASAKSIISAVILRPVDNCLAS